MTDGKFKMISEKIQLSLYERMLKIREFEEKIVQLYPEQEMRCPVHLSIGQEATAAGMCETLRKSDPIFGNHRSHGHYIAKGGNLRRMLAEIYGKVTGCGKGVGGSMHLIDLEAGVMATTPIVGSTIPIAVGAALANQIKRNGLVTTLFLGDAAVEEGVFHESLNFAILKELPIIFFCENNFYSVYTHLDQRQPKHRDISEMVRGHGIPAQKIDGNDVLAVFNAAQEAYCRVQSGKGPVFIEAVTYRWLLAWKEKCPLERMELHLLKEKIATPEALLQMRTKILEEIDDAVEFARSSPFPQPEQLFENVYA
jgi:TPP-dependent pyruvate/acetoin dehydrogenase alpha subunit